MAALVLALLMSQAYSEVSSFGSNLKITHSVSGDVVSFTIVQTATTAGKYLAIAFGKDVFTADDTDVIVCGCKTSPTAMAYDAHSISGAPTVDGKNGFTVDSTKTKFDTTTLTCVFTRKLTSTDA